MLLHMLPADRECSGRIVRRTFSECQSSQLPHATLCDDNALWTDVHVDDLF